MGSEVAAVIQARRFDRRRIIYLLDLLRELVVRDTKLRYKRSVVGGAWSLLVPLAQLAILSFVFGVVLDRTVEQFSTFLVSGVLPWTWFSASLMGATRSAQQDKDLLRQVGLPVAILPAITATSQLVHRRPRCCFGTRAGRWVSLLLVDARPADAANLMQDAIIVERVGKRYSRRNPNRPRTITKSCFEASVVASTVVARQALGVHRAVASRLAR